MDFWSTYKKKTVEGKFSSQQFWLNTGERPNASLARCQERSVELGTGKALSCKWNPKRRYLIAKAVAFDLFVSFYDINSKGMVAMRLTEPLGRKELHGVKKAVRAMKNANIEMRAIGLQNGCGELVDSIGLLGKAVENELVEADLFGNQTRHMVIDLLTGRPYSLLLENRIYRPGELVNTMKKEEFERTRGRLSFD